MPNAVNNVAVLCPHGSAEDVEVAYRYGAVLTAVYKPDWTVPEVSRQGCRLELA